MRWTARIRREQTRRWRHFWSLPQGAPRVAVLMQWSRIVMETPTVEQLRLARRCFNRHRKSVLGEAGLGKCCCCGGSAQRVWHHVIQLQYGGDPLAHKNKLRICVDCHNHVHQWAGRPTTTKDIYLRADEIVRGATFTNTPRLVKEKGHVEGNGTEATHRPSDEGARSSEGALCEGARLPGGSEEAAQR